MTNLVPSCSWGRSALALNSANIDLFQAASTEGAKGRDEDLRLRAGIRPQAAAAKSLPGGKVFVDDRENSSNRLNWPFQHTSPRVARGEQGS